MEVSSRTSRCTWTTAARVGVAALATAGLGYGAWHLVSRRRASASTSGALAPASARKCAMRVRLLYGSVTGTSERWARRVAADVSAEALGAGIAVETCVEDLASFLFDSLLEKSAAGAGESPPAEVVIVLLSTQAEGSPPEKAAHFVQLLEDHLYDFRVSKTALAHLSFAVVGFGSSEYGPSGHYCTAALRVDKALSGLGGRRLLTPLRVTDTDDMAKQLKPWTPRLLRVLWRLAARGEVAMAPPPAAAVLLEGGFTGAAHVEDEDDDSDSDASSTTAPEDAGASAGANGADVEDLDESCAGTTDAKEMLTGKMRQQLTKEGYKIVGSHSAVKLCRWTKHQLRGRGGCYKHSFYGISSYQCMEATPSLACANKCTFCWRHHKNPVGTTWKWKMDDPNVIVREGIESHRKMIRECKGIPGVKPERYEEALTVKHCALSLVGEPIMYPRINEFVEDLHGRGISTFLVTNAQFPEAIRSLRPITQLYVSCDAATPEALKAVDRPLFADYWERYLESLRAIRDKKQRTVYRLTLVKDGNMSDPAAYAKLVALGDPDFIEIKSVTFCGESKASSLTIGNVPWHEEVKAFSEAMLAAEGLDDQYELACEHQHSNIVLIAHKRYKINGKWHTWIDYDKFHQLAASGSDFGVHDYLAETPSWAVYGAAERGFDPNEKREFHNRTKRRAKEGLLSEAQLRQYGTDPSAA
eukprot:TRINITY_DN47355_c0_g1_i1.p1 TRINITY_DN47355_c0_g1~~TRINITY_DN47355_c0_g1_i1.p1  ORF type:complete len:700 (-),score=142.86 TRINITY_DN47355_c0_g1_i1:136-2235(-)